MNGCLSVSGADFGFLPSFQSSLGQTRATRDGGRSNDGPRDEVQDEESKVGVVEEAAAAEQGAQKGAFQDCQIEVMGIKASFVLMLNTFSSSWCATIDQ